jgi:FkbM family methyltransferase
MAILQKMIRRVRQRLFPTESQRAKQQWLAEGGPERRFDYDLDRDSVVLDLGGYQGQWASDLFSRMPCQISIFEVVPSFANNIEARFAKNDMVQVYSFGLGDSTREETIHLNDDGSSLFRDTGNAQKIQIVDVKQWFEEHDIDRVALMKINIEGAEYELLERMIETGLIERVDNLQIQFHHWVLDAKARMQAIRDKLAGTHEPTYQYLFIWENWQRLAQNDQHIPSTAYT